MANGDRKPWEGIPLKKPNPAYLPPIGGAGTPAQNAPVILNPNSNVYMWNEQGKPVFLDDGSAKKYFDILNEKQMAPLVQTMNDVYGEGKWKWNDLRDGWETGVDMAASIKATTGQNVSVWDTFAMNAKRNAQYGLTAGGRAAGGGGGAGGPSYAKQTSVNLTDPATARGLIDDALGSYLGRKATSKEQQAFLKALNIQEQASPTVTEQVTTRSGARSSSTQSKTTGGFNPATFAEEYAAGTEGAGEFQAATSLLDTFIKAIGAKV